jgi:hypothetical protein
MPRLKGPVPQVQAKEGPMPQLMNKRRSGWAILAAGAMVASLLAVGAAPAAAITASSTADAASDRTACLGLALEDAGFTDVSMGSAHYDNINCIAYYDITFGTSADTFSPSANVTRSQMALFLSRMAARTGVDLDDLSDADFTDLDGQNSDRVDAINSLVNEGIMTGTGDDTFSPNAHVTRAEMALWLVSFVDALTDDVDLDPDTGQYTLKNAPGTHDSFDDSLVSQPIHVHRAISVAFELGITTGYGDLEFKGHRHVSRQEMATFLMRTLAHTNLRPEGLTAQSSGTGDLSIQVSMRAADFVPIDNEPIDVFGALFAEAAFNDDRECVRRYVARVSGATAVCEIDAGDFLTGTDGNSNFMATAESVRPQQDTIACGIAGTYTVGSPIGDLANVEFWAWNGAYGDTVDEDTDLVKVVHVTPFSRTAGIEPDHAEVSGGLDIGKNQLEAEMGDVVPYTVQLHGIGPEGVHVDTGPGDEDAEYNVVISKFAVAYATANFDGNADTPNTRERVAASDANNDDATASVTVAEKASAQPYIRTPRVRPVDSDGTLTIELTHGDPDRRKNNDDVIVEILITPVIDNDLLIQEGADADDTNQFSDSVVFSDDGVDQTRIVVSAATTPPYRRAPTTGRSANGFVSITVIDQYGKPVRGQGVHAVSDAEGTDSNASPDNTVRFQNWYVTNSSGTHTIGYSYNGGIGVENLMIMNTGSPKTIDPVTNVDEPDDPDTAVNESTLFAAQRLPPASARLYWAVDGVQENSPVAGYGPIVGTVPMAGEWLVIDTDNDTLVVLQAAVMLSDQTTNEAQDLGPHMYTWDERDTFTVGNSRVTMEQFEEIVGGGTEKNKVTVGTITWDDYDYYVYNDRANWTVTGSCTQGVDPDL